jgi:hypothetical protein
MVEGIRPVNTNNSLLRFATIQSGNKKQPFSPTLPAKKEPPAATRQGENLTNTIHGTINWTEENNYLRNTALSSNNLIPTNIIRDSS